MTLLLSALPLLIVLVGVGALSKPAKIVGPISLAVALALSYWYFGMDGSTMFSSVTAGVKTAIQTSFMLCMAITVLTLLRQTGALKTIINFLAGITDDRRIQVVMVGLGFGSFLEGVAGAGSPAAIAAPFMVSLGVDPLLAVAAALVANGLTPCFGGVGVPAMTSVLLVEDVTSVTYLNVTIAIAMLLAVCCLVVPSIMLLIAFGKRALHGMKKFLLYISLIAGGTYFCIAYFAGPEMIAMGTGIVVVIACVLYAKRFAGETPEEFRFKKEDVQGEVSGKAASLWRALATYAMIFVGLPTIRMFLSLDTLNRYGHTTYVGTVILGALIIGSLILGCLKELPKMIWTTFKGMLPAVITMLAMLSMAKLCQNAGMLKNISEALTHAGAVFYPVISLLIGTLGAFATGGAYNSIVMFSRMNFEAASLLNINECYVLAAQDAGGALGNMICPHNIISASTTVGLMGREGAIFRKVIGAWTLLAVIVSLLLLLYTQVLFPGFGMV